MGSGPLNLAVDVAGWWHWLLPVACCCRNAPAADLHGMRDPGFSEAFDSDLTPFVCAWDPEKHGTSTARVITADLPRRLPEQAGVERLRHCLLSNIWKVNVEKPGCWASMRRRDELCCCAVGTHAQAPGL